MGSTFAAISGLVVSLAIALPAPAASAGRLSARQIDAAWTGAPEARLGQRVTVHGTVAGLTNAASLKVTVEKSVGSGWSTAATARTSGDEFTVSFLPTQRAAYHHYRVVARGVDGTEVLGVSVLPRLDVYRLHRYVVATKGKITANVKEFAAVAAQIYAHPRGWRQAHRRFQRVSTGGDFTLVLAQARYLPSYSSTCSATYSCRAGRYVVINQTRWLYGSKAYPAPLASYRSMVVNHETGHWLGRGHAYCPAKGALAPVMQQQSKSMQGCRPNPWPLAREIVAVS